MFSLADSKFYYLSFFMNMDPGEYVYMFKVIVGLAGDIHSKFLLKRLFGIDVKMKVLKGT